MSALSSAINTRARLPSPSAGLTGAVLMSAGAKSGVGRQPAHRLLHVRVGDHAGDRAGHRCRDEVVARQMGSHRRAVGR